MLKYYFLVFSIISIYNFVESFNMDLDVESVTGLFMDYIDETLKASFAQRSVDNIKVSDVYLNPRELINKSTELFVSLLDERIRALNNIKESVVKSYTVPQFEPTTILCKNENGGESNFNFQSKVALSRFCDVRHSDSQGQQVFLTSEFYDTASKSLIENPALKWQYYCSERGVLSFYPSSKLENVPDCRTRPWYIISVTQTKKEYVFILDRSGSMNTYINGVKLFDLAKEAIKLVIGRLHPEDKFAVVIASDDFITPGNFTFSNCFDTNFALGIDKNAALFGNFLDKLDATGGSSYISALSRAFGYFKKENKTGNETETVERILVMVSDSQINEGPVEISTKIEAELLELNNDIRLVVFGVGNANFSLFNDILNFNSEKQGELFEFKSIADIKNKLLFFYKRYEDPTMLMTKSSWTLPYNDVLGLGVLFTLSSPVFDNQNLLGVAGIDITVQEILNELDIIFFNPYNYIFMTTSAGYLLYHPSFPVISNDDIFATVTLFEQGTQFAEGLAQILAGSTEYIIINASDSSHSIPLGGDAYHGSVLENIPKQYFLKKVGQYPFIVGLSIASSSFQLFNVTYSQPGTILHNRLDLVPPSNICQHLGQDASIDLATVFFTPLGFKDPLRYVTTPLNSQVIKDIVSYLEGSPENPQEVKEFVRGNVAFTGILQELWKLDDDENAPLRRNSFLRFVALFSGVTRFYPGSQIPDNFDPTARAWFRQISSYSNLSFVVVSPYFDVTTNTPVITVGRSLRYKKKEKISRNQIIGVLGMDISLFVFNENFLEIYPKCRENTRYRCYLFDLGGFPLAVSYFRPNDWFDQDRRRWEDHITELEPAISRILIEKNIMRVLKCQTFAIGEIGIAYHIYLEDNQEFSGFYRQSFFDVFNFKIVQIPDSNVVLLIRTLPIVSCFPGTFSCPCRKSLCYSTEETNSFCQCPCYSSSSLYIPCNNSYNTFENDIPPCVPVLNIRYYVAPAVEESKILSLQDEESRNQPCYDVNFRTIYEVIDKGLEWALIMMSISITVIFSMVLYIRKNHKKDLDYDETNAVYWSQTSKTGLSKGSYTSFDATVRLHTLETSTNTRSSMPHSSGVTGFKNKTGVFGKLKRTFSISASEIKVKAENSAMLDIDRNNSKSSYLNQYESAMSTLNPVKSLWKRVKHNTVLFDSTNQSDSSFLTLKTQTSTTYKSARIMGSSTSEYVDVAEEDDASDDDYENAKQINDISDANLYEDTSV